MKTIFFLESQGKDATIAHRSNHAERSAFEICTSSQKSIFLHTGNTAGSTKASPRATYDIVENVSTMHARVKRSLGFLTVSAYQWVAPELELSLNMIIRLPARGSERRRFGGREPRPVSFQSIRVLSDEEGKIMITSFGFQISVFHYFLAS